MWKEGFGYFYMALVFWSLCQYPGHAVTNLNPRVYGIYVHDCESKQGVRGYGMAQL